MATALLYGLKMDTLNLARNVTALDIEMLGYLFPYCDPDTLADLERNNMEFTDLKAYGAAIENIEHSADRSSVSLERSAFIFTKNDTGGFPLIPSSARPKTAP